MNRIVLALLVTGALALAATPALAAKGGGGGKRSESTVSLVLLDSTDGVAHYGHRVTFDVSTTATDRPFVGVRCWQGPNWVYDGYVGFFPTYMFDPWLRMGSPYWTPTAEASCTARLFYYDKRGNQKVLATLDFPVSP